MWYNIDNKIKSKGDDIQMNVANFTEKSKQVITTASNIAMKNNNGENYFLNN